jgi:hypothetical protein
MKADPSCHPVFPKEPSAVYRSMKPIRMRMRVGKLIKEIRRITADPPRK